MPADGQCRQVTRSAILWTGRGLRQPRTPNGRVPRERSASAHDLQHTRVVRTRLPHFSGCRQDRSGTIQGGLNVSIRARKISWLTSRLRIKYTKSSHGKTFADAHPIVAHGLSDLPNRSRRRQCPLKRGIMKIRDVERIGFRIFVTVLGGLKPPLDLCLCLGPGPARIGRHRDRHGLDPSGSVVQGADLELRDIATNDARKADDPGAGRSHFSRISLSVNTP